MAAPKFLSFAALPPGKDVQINTTVKEVSHSIPIVIDAGNLKFYPLFVKLVFRFVSI